MRFEFSSLVALVAAVSVAAQPTAAKLPFNPPPSLVHPVDASLQVGSSASVPEPATNAERFAIGLPPLSPRAHHRHRLHAPHGGSKVDTARRSTTSPAPPVSAKCNILVKTADTTLGYIRPLWNIFGEYGQFQASQDGALEVSFSYSPDSPSQLDFTATNGPSATYPFFGAINGFSSDSNDMGPGSPNYAFVGGTTQSTAGPATQGDNSFSEATGIPRAFESAIWTYDPTAQAITAQWTNTDGSSVPTHIVFANDGDEALAITGDVEAMRSALGTSYPEVTFTCVAPTGVQPI